MDCRDVQPGAQASYLIDLYHVCGHLSAAAPQANEVPADGPPRQKERLNTGELSTVSAELASRVEPENVPNEDAPVRRCHRYIANRPNQFNHPAAAPIGSSEDLLSLRSNHR